MKKSGIPYYIRETNRYDDTRISKLIARLNASAVTVYDFLLEKAFKEEGCYLQINSDVVFLVAQALRLRESFVEEVISQCCNVGLFDKDVHANGGVITSATILEKYKQTCRLTHRKPIIPESLSELSGQNEEMSRQNGKMSGQNKEMSRHFDEMSGQNGDLSRQNAEMSRQIQTKTETEKENPPAPPYKEKEKEKKHYNNSANPQIFDDSEIEVIEPTVQNTLTPAEKRDKAIEARKKREQDFYNELIPYVEIYGAEMIRDFYDYWTEPTKSGTQIRKDKQPTWCTERRLGTWARNNFNGNGRIITNPAGSTSASTDRQPSDSYSKISDFISQRIV